MAVSQKRIERIWVYLIREIGNDYGVSGLMGNLMAESNLNPELLQSTGRQAYSLSNAKYCEAVNHEIITKSKFIRDGFGFGLAQWTYRTRKERLYNHWLSYKNCCNKANIGDLYIQLEYLVMELKSKSYKTKVFDKLKNVKSVMEATEIVMKNYEKPADQSDKALKKRYDYAEKIYKTMNGEVSTTPTAKDFIKKYVRVNRTSVYVRSGPNTGYDAEGIAYKGDLYPYLKRAEKGKGWYKIIYRDKECWITDKYTTICEED